MHCFMDPDIDIALLEDAVLGQKPRNIVKHLGMGLAEMRDIIDEVRRQVLMDAAGAKIGGMHARSRGALVEHHQLFALLEAPQRRRQRADIHGLRGDIEQMRQEPPDLTIKHPDELPALRHFDSEQPLGRQREGMLLVHRRDVVEAVEIGDCLEIGLVFDELLGAAVEKPDMGIDAHHDLAVELEHETQNPVRRRMLRAEVDREIAVLGDVSHGIWRVASGEWRMASACFASTLERPN